MTEIRCVNLKKHFGSVKAIDGIDLNLSGNKIIGLIGRNGAGKTTILKTIAGLLKPTEGTIKINGEIPLGNLKVLSNLVLSREELVFNDEYTSKIILDIASAYYRRWDNEYAAELSVLFNIDINKKIKKLSKGMKTILSIIVALASKVDVTIFDEPTEGLDAAYRKLFYRLMIKEASNQSRTFIISSHLLSELDTLLEEIILIDEGKLLLHQSMDDIREWCIELEGHKDKIEAFVGNIPIYHKQKLGDKQRVVVVKSDLDEEDFLKLESAQIRINPVSAQDSCIYLTQKEVL